MMKILSAALILSLMASGTLRAEEEIYRSAAVGSRWLDIPASARVASLAGAFAARGGEPGGIEANPATLAGTHDWQFLFTHNEWVRGLQVERLIGAWECGDAGTFAVGADYLNLGEIDRVEIDSGGNPVHTGKLHPNAMAFYGSWAKMFGRLGAGLTLRGISENLVSESQNNFEGDLGLRWSDPSGLRLGAALKNLPLDGSAELRPITVRGGIGYTIAGSNPLALDFNVDYPSQEMEPPSYRFAAEWAIFPSLILRGGYIAADARAPHGPTVGIGWLAGPLELDYAFYGAGDLGYSQLISVRILAYGGQ